MPQHHRGVAIRYFLPEPGWVRSISGVDEARQRPWVHRLELGVGPGDLVEPPTNHTQRPGFVITHGDTREEAVARALETLATVVIEVEPLAS